MNGGWKRCPNGDVAGRWAGLYITMNPKGFIVMSRKTFETIKSPDAVQLFFDTVNNRIGVKGIDPRSRDVFRVAKQGRHGGRLIRAYRIMQEFGIVLPHTVRFENPVVDNEGILVLDLRTATAKPKTAGK